MLIKDVNLHRYFFLLTVDTVDKVDIKSIVKGVPPTCLQSPLECLKQEFLTMSVNRMNNLSKHVRLQNWALKPLEVNIGNSLGTTNG